MADNIVSYFSAMASVMQAIYRDTIKRRGSVKCGHSRCLGTDFGVSCAGPEGTRGPERWNLC